MSYALIHNPRYNTNLIFSSEDSNNPFECKVHVPPGYTTDYRIHVKVLTKTLKTRKKYQPRLENTQKV